MCASAPEKKGRETDSVGASLIKLGRSSVSLAFCCRRGGRIHRTRSTFVKARQFPRDVTLRSVSIQYQILSMWFWGKDAWAERFSN